LAAAKKTVARKAKRAVRKTRRVVGKPGVRARKLAA
jgi:hypothetical protein